MTDWSVLNPDGSSKDPVPGDPDEVGSLSRWFRNMSDDVADSASAIQRFDVAAGWRDAAGKRFEGRIGTLRNDLPKLRDSYDKAAWALGTYQGQLRTSQQEARQALSMALEAKANVDTAQRAKAAVTAAPAGTGPPPDTSAYDRQEQSGNQKLDQARALLQRAVDERDRAVQVCIKVLQDAHDVGMHNRGFWDSVGGFFGDVGHFIDEHLEDISNWCSRIGMVLAIAGMIFPVLEPIAIGISVIGLAADAGLAAEGKKSWGEVGFTAVLMAGTLGMGAISRGLAGKVADEAGTELVSAGERVTTSEAKLVAQQAKLDEAAARGEANSALKGWVTRRANALEDARAEVTRLGRTRSMFREEELSWKDQVTHVGSWHTGENIPIWKAIRSPGDVGAVLGDGSSASARWVRVALPASAASQGLDKLQRFHEIKSGVDTFGTHAEAGAR